MATFVHPETGVSLNIIDIHRPALDDAAVKTVHLLRAEGHDIHEIAAMLGTNPGRVAEALGPHGGTDPDQAELL